MDFDRVSLQSGVRLFERPGSDIRMTGYLKKLKTMKKKFFVLRSTSSSGPARLEYYDSEKKFNAGHLPKRSVQLHTCFNINKKSDSRHKNAIALYTKEVCFSIVCDNEKELENWLSLMLEYQNEYVRDDERCREHYEYVWQVTVQAKGLGQTMGIRGQYRLCMTRHTICLVKVNSDKPQYIFQLETVRSLAHNDNLFRMEVGKIAPTGEGELWMQCDDAAIAQNLHETILHFMKNMERRFETSEIRRSDNMHSSSSIIPRQSEFRHRTSSESFTQGSGRVRSKADQQRPMSSYTGSARSTSHIHSAVSPGSSPYTHNFDHPIMGSHRMRSDSNESKASRSSMPAICDDFQDMYSLSLKTDMALEEEPDFDGSFDQHSIPSSPGSLRADHDEYDGQDASCYMHMHPGSVTPPTSGNSGYMDMVPQAVKESRDGNQDHVGGTVGSPYLPMNPSWQSSAPIPIHPSHPDSSSMGYMDMTSHNPLPPVKEGGSTEGYVPMSPGSYSASPSGSNSSHLRPDRVACMLSDDGSDFSHQPPLRTYSLGSRPVKTTGLSKYSGYVDMSGSSSGVVGKGVSDNGRSCSAPHLITHPHHHREHRSSCSGSRGGTMDSPTPSASPLSVSLKSDDSDSLMELDFYRPRTASDSYSYRPRASSFGMPHSMASQGHRPRSSSHGQGTRPLRRHKMLGGMGAEGAIGIGGRFNHDMLHRSQNSSAHGSFDSLRVSSSESLRKLSQEVRTKTSQLNNNNKGGADYMDMSFEKRHTPSPQPGGSASSRASGQNGYVDMTLGGGHRKASSPNCSSSSKTASHHGSSKTSSSEKLQQESEYTNMTLGSGASSGTGTDPSVYMNLDTHDGGAGKKESPSRSSSSENVDTYMMYEPATTPTGTSPASASSLSSVGKGGSSKVDMSGVDPRSRSGSGSSSKEHKKRGFFSRRHTQGESSSKQSSKKSESAAQGFGGGGAAGGGSYSSTGGDKFGSLGRNIRQKSKDCDKSNNNNAGGSISGRKSHSFSRTFGTSATKPGKLLRKTPTPPKSLDGNDEYIEFSPLAVKSDSDSSHSSGSTHASRSSRHEIISSKQEAEYVGFEPGNIPASSNLPSSSLSSSTSGYVSMNAASGNRAAGSQGSHFKPVKKSSSGGIKRSKSREEPSTSSQPSPVTPPISSSSSFTRHSPAGEEEQLLAKPVPVYPPVPDVPSATPPVPSLVHDIALGEIVGEESSEKTPTPSASSSLLPSPDSSVPASPSSSSTSSFVAVSTSASKLSPTPAPLPASDSGYMDFDPGKPANSGTASLAKPALVASCITSEKVSSSPSSAAPSAPADSTAITAPSQSCSSSFSAPVALRRSPSSDSKNCSGCGGQGQQASPSGCSRDSPVPTVTASSIIASPATTTASSSGRVSLSKKMSSEKLGIASSNNGNGGNKSSQGSSSGEDRGSGGSLESSGRSSKGKEPRRPHQGSQESQSGSGNLQQGLTRPDSTPCMLNLEKAATATPSSGRGRGRHSSSSSAMGGTQSKKGKNNNGSSKDCSSGKLEEGMLQINPEADARHSITDLSGYEQITFPSNALSRQQPAHFRQHHPSSTSSGGSGGGGSQGVLNYAKLDLGSADSMGDNSGEVARSPRNKSRHASANDDKSQPLSYATIDFEKSESLRSEAAPNKDIKRTL